MLFSLIARTRVSNSRLHSLGRVAGHALGRLGGRLGCLAHALRQGGFIVVGSVGPLVSVNLVFAVLLDERSQVLDGAGAGVCDGLRFAASGEELDGGEALDLVGDVVGCGVHLSNGHFAGGGIHGGELFVFGGQSEIGH